MAGHESIVREAWKNIIVKAIKDTEHGKNFIGNEIVIKIGWEQLRPHVLDHINELRRSTFDGNNTLFNDLLAGAMTTLAVRNPNRLLLTPEDKEALSDLSEELSKKQAPTKISWSCASGYHIDLIIKVELP